MNFTHATREQIHALYEEIQDLWDECSVWDEENECAIEEEFDHDRFENERGRIVAGAYIDGILTRDEMYYYMANWAFCS